MPERKSARRRRWPGVSSAQASSSSVRRSRKRVVQRLKPASNLISRASPPTSKTRVTSDVLRGPAESDVPEATVRAAGGPVSVEIRFGHAQHGKYTIQLFDPAGTTELAREPGLSTDERPDRFDLKPSASQLHQHLVQWSGAVDAFSSAPGQQYSVIFNVTQDGNPVPGGHVEKTGPLTITQAFLGILRLVAS